MYWLPWVTTCGAASRVAASPLFGRSFVLVCSIKLYVPVRWRVLLLCCFPCPFLFRFVVLRMAATTEARSAALNVAMVLKRDGFPAEAACLDAMRAEGREEPARKPVEEGKSPASTKQHVPVHQRLGKKKCSPSWHLRNFRRALQHTSVSTQHSAALLGPKWNRPRLLPNRAVSRIWMTGRKARWSWMSTLRCRVQLICALRIRRRVAASRAHWPQGEPPKSNRLFCHECDCHLVIQISLFWQENRRPLVCPHKTLSLVFCCLRACCRRVRWPTVCRLAGLSAASCMWE